MCLIIRTRTSFAHFFIFKPDKGKGKDRVSEKHCEEEEEVEEENVGAAAAAADNGTFT